MHEHEEDPHAGGTGGGESRPTPEDEAPRGNSAESVGPGDIEIPLGVPMSKEELRRLKEAARSPGRDGAEQVTEQGQQDDDRDGRAQEDQS
jgi:hypothetical protein